MQTIKLSNFTKEAASKAKGEKLRETMVPLLDAKSSFSVDFEGITRFASPFFNNSFASLALIYGFDTIKEIHLLNISDVGQMTYETSLDNAYLIFNNPDYAETINRIINENLPKKDA